MEFFGKANKAKEESLIKQYKEEINLIITDEIVERKTQKKEEAMIQSLEEKIRQKEWVKEIEKYNRLSITTKEGYKIEIEVNNQENKAWIVEIIKRRNR